MTKNWLQVKSADKKHSRGWLTASEISTSEHDSTTSLDRHTDESNHLLWATAVKSIGITSSKWNFFKNAYYS